MTVLDRVFLRWLPVFGLTCAVSALAVACVDGASGWWWGAICFGLVGNWWILRKGWRRGV